MQMTGAKRPLSTRASRLRQILYWAPVLWAATTAQGQVRTPRTAWQTKGWVSTQGEGQEWKKLTRPKGGPRDQMGQRQWTVSLCVVCCDCNQGAQWSATLAYLGFTMISMSIAFCSCSLLTAAREIHRLFVLNILNFDTDLNSSTCAFGT